MSFLRDYTDYASGNEAPPIFHVWGALSALSAIVSRRVWIRQGMFTFYPNLYVMFVGPPGDGKTTAMSIGKKLIRRIGDIPLAATAATPQAIMELMQKSELNKKPLQKQMKVAEGRYEEYTPLAIFATEFSQFIGMNAPGWIDFLTTIYDEEVYEVNTKNKGNNIIPGPYISVLGCMTDDTTSTYLKQNIISGGYSRRCIFVYSTGRGKPQAFPEETTEQKMQFERCVDWGVKLKKVQGEFTWTNEARGWYEKWYVATREKLDRESDPVTVGYMKSKHVQLLKTAMLLAISESLTELVVTQPLLELGLGLLEQAEVNLHKVFAGTGRNELAGVAAKIYAVLDSQSAPIPLKKLKATFYKDCTMLEFDQVIFHLEEAGKVLKQGVEVNGTAVTLIGTPRCIKNFRTKIASETSATQPVGGPTVST